MKGLSSLERHRTQVKGKRVGASLEKFLGAWPLIVKICSRIILVAGSASRNTRFFTCCDIVISACNLLETMRRQLCQFAQFVMTLACKTPIPPIRSSVTVLPVSRQSVYGTRID